MSHRLRFLACTLLALCLVGCGFQPRGQLRLPENTPGLALGIPDPYSLLAEDLERALRRSGVEVLEAGPGTATLVVEREAWQERPLSVDNFVTVREVEIRYEVAFRIDDAKGGVLVPSQTLSMGRDYVYAAQQAFGVPGEQEILRREIRLEMVAAMLRRVDVVLRSR